jgi:ADP-ribose pyrophosphatase YjhB (NUDIX family)
MTNDKIDQDQWLMWARELQAIAQTGLTYTHDAYDRQRYERLREITAEIVAANTDRSAAELHRILEIQDGYATPKVDVRAACFRNGEVLLVQESSDGLWSLPGGWADVNVSPTEAVIREVWEESGFRVSVRKLAAVLDRNKHPHPPILFHAYKMFFVCDVIDGTPTPSIETLDAAFFPLDQLPPLSVGRTLPGQILRMHEHLVDPTLPVDCD